MLQGWLLYVIIYEKHTIEVVCEYVCVQLGGLYGLMAMSMELSSAQRIFW